MTLLNNLLCWYKLDGNANNSVSGSFNGSVSGAVSSSFGKMNRAYSFSGSNYIYIGQPVSTTFSVSLWVNANSFSNSKVLFTLGGSSSSPSNTNFYFITTTANNTFFAHNHASSQETGACIRNKWYHLVYTSTPSGASLYLDGNLISSGAGQSSSSNSHCAIGNLRNQDQAFDGFIDEVGVWNRALTGTEVSQLYALGKGITYSSTLSNFISGFSGGTTLKTNLISYYKFDGNTNDSYSTNNATNNGATIINGKMSQGYKHTANANNINLNFYRNQVPISYSIWINASYLNDWRTIIANRAANTAQAQSFAIRLAVRQIVLDNGQSELNTGINITDDTWHHIVLTINTADTKLYLDGVLRYSNASGTNSNSTENFLAGYGFTYGFTNGTYDELSIWSKVLTAAEVQELYNLGWGVTYSVPDSKFIDETNLKYGLIGYWSLDENSNTNWNDSLLLNNISTSDNTFTTTLQGKINRGLAISAQAGATNRFVGKTTPVGLDATEDVTISLWFKVNIDSALTNNAMNLIAVGHGSTGWDNTYFLSVQRINSTNYTLDVWGAQTSNVMAFKITSNNVYPNLIAGWNHIVIIRKKNGVNVNAKMYLNATELTYSLQSNTDTLLRTSYTPKYLQITGHQASTAGGTLNSNCDEIGVWNKYFTATEITALYNSGAGFAYPFVTSAPSNLNFFTLSLGAEF
jgi:hypothetical protein